ncbi:unnamed protein product [Trifolium pratense]|uniref:Uncharacterized protein n=1 Tax=Trifolium pratense TaxID=57577 RepID=A0ACB0LCP5_TRIPR|nr:unnamed protein product [Trifolium pratense]
MSSSTSSGLWFWCWVRRLLLRFLIWRWLGSAQLASSLFTHPLWVVGLILRSEVVCFCSKNHVASAWVSVGSCSRCGLGLIGSKGTVMVVVQDFVAAVGSVGSVRGDVSLFGSKEPLLLAVRCRRGLLVRGSIRAGGQLIRHSL